MLIRCTEGGLHLRVVTLNRKLIEIKIGKDRENVSHVFQNCCGREVINVTDWKRSNYFMKKKKKADNFSHWDELHCCWHAAYLTMQSCMILFQSSPVTIRKRTVIALPAVEKLACLRWGGDGKTWWCCKAALYCVPDTQPAWKSSLNKKQKTKKKRSGKKPPKNYRLMFSPYLTVPKSTTPANA